MKLDPFTVVLVDAILTNLVVMLHTKLPRTEKVKGQGHDVNISYHSAPG